MEKLEKHSRELNIYIDRISLLRAFQSLFEVNNIDTSHLNDSFYSNKRLSILIKISAYTDDDNEYFSGKKIFSKFELIPEYNKKDINNNFVDIVYIKNILDNSRIII